MIHLNYYYKEILIFKRFFFLNFSFINIKTLFIIIFYNKNLYIFINF
jgi:hypothetical protein